MFEISDFEWLRGDPATALADPSAVVLTASAARKYFGDLDPIGQTLLFGEGIEKTLTVTGVIEDLPDDTHLAFNMLGSMLAWTGSGWRNERFYDIGTLFFPHVRAAA